jgi:hypothetical protein
MERISRPPSPLRRSSEETIRTSDDALCEPLDIAILLGRHSRALGDRQTCNALATFATDARDVGVHAKVFGDGSTPLTPAGMREIGSSGLIGPKTQIEIWAHGGTDRSTNTHKTDGVSTVALIEALSPPDSEVPLSADAAPPQGTIHVDICESGSLARQIPGTQSAIAPTDLRLQRRRNHSPFGLARPIGADPSLCKSRKGSQI